MTSNQPDFAELLAEQTKILAKIEATQQEILATNKSRTKILKFNEALSWGKQILWFGGLAWFVLQAKSFFQNMFTNITPDFSFLEGNGIEADGDGFNEILNGVQQFFQ